MNKFAITLLVLLLPALALAAGPDTTRPDSVRTDLSAHFTAQGVEGCFVAETDTGVVRVNPERCARPFRPASSFKIINALTAFENHVADPALVMKWDGVRHPDFPAWDKDLNLEEAFRASAVWYFVRLGRMNGRERLAAAMRALDYGNADASGSDQFWIDGPLAISADNQVRVLGRLARGQTEFSPRSLDLLRRIMLLDSGVDAGGGLWRLYAKTGLAPFKSAADPSVGWFVGFVERVDERGDRILPFALNLSPMGESRLTPAQLAARSNIARAMLCDLGILPKR
jgi:beta-lactamase class D